MLFTDVIRTKRDGGELTDEQIDFFVSGLTDESIPAEQVSSLAMAIYLNSMNFDEAAKLTLAMSKSGEVIQWSQSGIDGPIVDKHSTGGVGDKVSFILAPVAAACGCFVPMISGRGLGHTGGTTDKAEAIPGYNPLPDLGTFKDTVKEVGCAIIGQTADLAPADKRFYAVRDVTATVESVPLITASILSKKIAAGLDALIMDVKVGTGAFMRSIDQARELANSLVTTASRANLKTHVLITDMNQVLGTSAGNAVEIYEVVRYLRNEHREPRLDAVVLNLCAEMLLATKLESDKALAISRCETAITSGKAAEVFSAMCTKLGAPADFFDNYQHYLGVARVVRPIFAQGYLCSVNAREVGNAIIELGGGRSRVGQALDLSVGFSDMAPVGALVDDHTPLAVVHAATEDAAFRAQQRLLAACEFSDDRPIEAAIIVETLSS